MSLISIVINGEEVLTSPGKTILEAVHESRLDKIPTLCHDGRLEHYTSCFICMVEIEGMNKLVPSCSTVITKGMSISTRSPRVLDTRKTALELLMSNHYADCIGPCTNNCPAGVDAQTYIALIAMGKYEEALKLVKENNPLPLSIGRVCVRDCEAACRRKYVDDTVGINSLKRFIADKDNVNKWRPRIEQGQDKKIAVIGGGPSGLSCAYYLRLKGCQVTIMEKLPKLGGMLRYGIPEYRLPKEILDSEIEWILSLGIDVKTGIQLGRDFSINSLLANGYDAVYLAVGAHKASKMGLEGEDSIEKVYRGIDFLREVELNGSLKLSGTVIVVGGGNTAIDAARTALRCGAEKVKIVYRRSIKEMPAHPEEIEAAMKEGVEILFLNNPVRIISEDNRIKGIECIKMRLEEAPGERPRPVPCAGSEFILDCSWLISAIGQSVDTAFVQQDNKLNLEKWGTVKINTSTLETSEKGVFAGGDVATGPLTAIAAIAHGKKAALAILSWLEKGMPRIPQKNFYSLKHNISSLSEREFNSIGEIEKQKMPELAVCERINSFDEVELGLHEEQAYAEALRCMECGCSEYYNCTLRKYCDEYGIDTAKYKGEVKKYQPDNRHPFIVLDPNKCIGCGRCVRTCSEILQVSALGFVYRGFKSIVKPAMEKSLQETNCINCGCCIDACPTGAVSQKFNFRILGTLPKDDIETICGFCPAGCRVNFRKIDNDIFYVSNTTEEVVQSHNRGWLCVRGRFGIRYAYNKNRILTPSIKRHGSVHNVSTEDALLYTEKTVKSILRTYGRDSVAVFASPALSNEELYLLQKFTRAGLNNNNIHSFTNMLAAPEQDSMDDMMGFTASTVSLGKLNSADVIVVINGGLNEDNLVMELKIKEAVKKGAKLILVSSSESRLARYADLWVDARKGTTAYLMNSVIKCFIDAGLEDKEFIESRCTGYENLLKNSRYFHPEDAASLAGIDLGKMTKFITLLSDLRKKIIFIYNGESAYDRSVNDLKAIGSFLLLTGRIIKENNGLILLSDNMNSAGMREMGAVPSYLPGFVKFNETQEIRKTGQLWQTDLNTIFRPSDIKEKLKSGKIKAALIFGENPLAVPENIKYFNHLRFLAVADSFYTETIHEADTVLPLSTHIEKRGTFIRCDNVIQPGRNVIDNPLDMDNWQMIAKLASCFSPQFRYLNEEDILREIIKTDRFMEYSENSQTEERSRFEKYFSNSLSAKKFNFIDYSVDITSFDPVRPALHFQDAFYTAQIRSRLI
ncbi:MAG: NAD(P)-binding protein [Syntrophothermus sp.]